MLWRPRVVNEQPCHTQTCDGGSPCTRCKTDDAICAYGKFQKSQKTVFRSGYVQMLERQHAELIAGLQELYRRTQNAGGWSGPRLETENADQPLTHKILEALGVLQPDGWKGTESVVNEWRGLEHQVHDESGWTYSEPGSPSTQAASPLPSPTPTPTPFPHSTIMLKRRARQLQTTLAAPTAQTLLSMPPPPPPFTADFACTKPELYGHASPTQMRTPSDAFPSTEEVNMGLCRASDAMMDWSLGMDGLFGGLGGG